MSRLVEAKCSVCGKTQIRKKGKSGLPCVNGGVYCGVMHVLRWIKDNEGELQ